MTKEKYRKPMTDKMNSSKTNADKAAGSKTNADKMNSSKTNADKMNGSKTNADKMNGSKTNADKANGSETNSSKTADKTAGSNAAAGKLQNQYDALKLENQLCFPLYACSKEVVRRYKPYLDAVDLTYTQYIAMMVLWEHKEISVKEIGEFLYLDSGTLTPVLKTLEKKGFLTRERSKDDERVMKICITKEGLDLRERAADIPLKMGACIRLTPEEAQELYTLLYKLLSEMEAE